ncbi:MAG: ATP-binding protein [Verrucomicrobia bacterium]|nr:MAG: ATP-binding protein [Verrucomicrobiota bacterium]
MLEKALPHSRQAVKAELMRRLQEPPPGRIQVLTGPRQVGKTTLLLELARQLPNAVYHAVDTPEAALPGWWEGIWRDVRLRQNRGPVQVFLDEIQYLAKWDRLVKAKIDEIVRQQAPVHLVLSGSSALLVGRGLTETLAGRFEHLRLLHWSARDLATAFDLSDQSAVEILVREGSYPGAFPLRQQPDRWRAYIRDSIIEPAIGRDVLVLHPVRKPALLRQLFMIVLGHPAEIISLQKLVGQLHDRGALETVAHYLSILEQAYLVAALPKYSPRVVRRRAAPPKIVVLNNALMAAMQTVDESHPRWGAWVENACLAHAWNQGQEVAYWREEPLEVDAVLTGTWGRWAVEVKTGDFAPRDLVGLLEFCRRYPDFRPLVLCPQERVQDEIPGVHLMAWADFLWGRPLPDTPGEEGTEH